VHALVPASIMSRVIFRYSRQALPRIRIASVSLSHHPIYFHSFLRSIPSNGPALRWNSKCVRLFASGSYPNHIKLVMPALSPTMQKGNLAKWLKQEGDAVKPGDTLAEVETDKATVAFDSVEDGYLAKILVPGGTNDVPLGNIVAILVDSKEDIAAFKDFKADDSSQSQPEPPKQEAPKQEAPKQEAKQETQKQETQKPEQPKSESSSTQATGDRIIASPYARKEANEKGVDLSQIQGTGPNRRIVAADVHDYLAAGKPTTKPAPATSSRAQPQAPSAGAPGDYVDKPLSNIRKVIAQRLSQSKQSIPHYYASVDINMDKVLKLRSQLNAKLEKSGGKDKEKSQDNKLSVNDFIIKASALALRQVPTVNASWLDTFIREYKYVDISVAVSTDTGLITPIVKDADIKGLSAISREVRDLATRARQNKLQPHEFQGGTFTISNLGMFGVSHFCAIINPPQSAILAVGATSKRVEVNPDDKNGENPYKVSNVMTVTLSADHRIVDGALSAVWLQSFKNLLEDPQTMLL